MVIKKGVITCGRCGCASLEAQRQGPLKSVAKKMKRPLEMDPIINGTNQYNSRVWMKNKKQAMTPRRKDPNTRSSSLVGQQLVSQGMWSYDPT